MNSAWTVVLLIFVIWGFGLMTVSIADSMVRRRYSEHLEIRDWQEKVDAMKRLQDQEESDL